MDLAKIVADAEAEQRAQRERAAEEDRLKAERQEVMRQEHAAILSNLLTTIVEPCLEEGARQLRTTGFDCQIREIRAKDTRLKQIIIEVVLDILGKKHFQPDHHRANYVLQYVGDVDLLTVSVIMTIHGPSEYPMNGRNIPATEINSAAVEKHLELFVSKVVSSEAGGY